MGGHFAFHNTYHKIARRYYWESMKQDIQNIISRCDRCQKQGKSILNELLHPIPVKPEPWYQIVMDIKHFRPSRSGNRYVIVAIDYFTKWVEAKALRYANATEVALFLYEDVICRHGCPAIVINDNGLPFANKLVEEVCNQFSIEWRRGSPYRSQTQGLVERFNRSLGQMLKKRPKHEKDDWCSYLPAALFAYRTIIQETTKQTPFYLLYGREALTPFDRITEKTKEGIINEKWSDDQLVNKIKMQIELLQKVRKKADASIKASQKNQKAMIERKILGKKKHLMQPPFHIGDIVQVYNNAIETSWSGKLEETWLGPYIVHKANQRSGYQLKTLKGVMLNGITHGNRMRIYRLPDVQFQPSLSSSKKMSDQLNTLNQDSNLEQLPWDPTIVTSEELYKLLQDNPFPIRDIDDDFLLSLMEGDTDNHPQDLSLSPETIQLYQEYSRYENYRKNIAQHRARLAEKLVADITNKRNLRNLCHRRRSEGLKEILEANNLPHKLVTNSNNTIRRLFSRLWT
ncbi:hypothetical protein INT45_013816 [Circinella minor]|uniref:Integrase catalytic domain-containing protein n=1 Tax=Circinella minor TaxID=1195481 RepID=A0A8H7VJG5_9FUNG|nr:hypothetical protein INT45_013816 [Circinella minor]